MASRAALEAQLDATAERFAAAVPRPPHWGGYRLHAEAVELWVSRPARLHDRALWTRKIDLNPGPTPWQATRLQP